MKKLSILILGILIIVGSIVVLWTKSQVSAEGKNDFVRGEILVKFKDGVSSKEVENTHRKFGAKVKETIPAIGVQVVDIGSKNIGQAISDYARSGTIEFVEPNFIAKALTNDTYFNNQWGLHNIGQQTCNTAKDICTIGLDDADIDAPEAWNVTTGDSNIKIAILDSGIDQNHPDLVGKIADNINFTGSSSFDDYYGHGTHVAGIAAAETNNSVGVAGIGYNSKLMNVKVLGDDGYGAYSWIASGIIWASDNGAKVINMSLGGSQKSSTLQAAVNQAWSEGVVLVAAAGNSNNPSRTYPAYYSNCIAVAATDNNDVRASFSSYGSWVDVAAPGENIYSTFPNHSFYLQTVYGRSENYDFGSGTSMSTPFVSGLAALIWSTDLGTDNLAVRSRIETTADKISGTGTYWQWGRINACQAVGGNCSGTVPTPTPTPSLGPVPEPSLNPQPEACYNYCFRNICDGQCHPVKDKPECPDCQF